MNSRKKNKKTTETALRNVPYQRNWRRTNYNGITAKSLDELDDTRVDGELLKGAKFYLDIAIDRAKQADQLASAQAVANVRKGNYSTYKGRVRDFNDHAYPELVHDQTDWPLTEAERYRPNDQVMAILCAIEMLTSELERINRSYPNRTSNTPYAALDDEHKKHQLRRAEIAEKHQRKQWRDLEAVAVDIYPVLSNTAGSNVTTPAVAQNNVTAPPTPAYTNSSAQLQSV